MMARRGSPTVGANVTSIVHAAAGASSEPLLQVEDTAADQSVH